jgi:hypothetical protein
VHEVTDSYGSVDGCRGRKLNWKNDRRWMNITPLIEAAEKGKPKAHLSHEGMVQPRSFMGAI